MFTHEIWKRRTVNFPHWKTTFSLSLCVCSCFFWSIFGERGRFIMNVNSVKRVHHVYVVFMTLSLALNVCLSTASIVACLLVFLLFICYCNPLLLFKMHVTSSKQLLNLFYLVWILFFLLLWFGVTTHISTLFTPGHHLCTVWRFMIHTQWVDTTFFLDMNIPMFIFSIWSNIFSATHRW